MSPTIDLDSLLVLDSVIRNGSFSAAADELHRVRSSISYAIQKLEENLGIQIFDRRGQKAVLTTEGEQVLEQGRYLLDSANAFKKRFHNISQGWEPEFCLAISVLLPIKPILNCIRLFYEQGHKVNIKIIREAYGGTWDALEGNRADIVIGASGEIPPGFNTFSLGELKRVYAVSPKHPLACRNDDLSESELSQFQTVSISDSSRRLQKKHTSYLKDQVILSVPDIETKLLAQSMGLGGGLLPKGIAEKAQKQGKLKIMHIKDYNISPYYYMAWPKKHEGKALQWFVNAIKQPHTISALLNS